MKQDIPSHCELCQREIKRLTKHHLIPRTRHKNKKNKKMFSREDVKSRLIYLCRACHNQIHLIFSEKELERGYNTIESLLSHPEVIRFIDWIKNKPANLKVKRNRQK